jgi:ERCC4-related helicase
MSWPIEGVEVNDRLDFANPRVSERDALRQLQTVIELLRRLGSRPGVVLADEVGMGKTFVALGVAVIVALADRARRPVVVMVPPSLQDKWPNDFTVFSRLVLKQERDRRLTASSARSALEFFRLIDDPARTRPQIIFLKHGALHVGQIDHWVRLALIKRAMTGMHLGERRAALPRFAADLLRTRTSYSDERLFDRLLRSLTSDWMEAINAHYPDRPDLQVQNDPIPKAVREVLEKAELPIDNLKQCLRSLPARLSENIEARLAEMRGAPNEALRDLWLSAIREARFRSPLLILDKAHHLKNPETKLASLFVERDAEKEFDTVAGALHDWFERMLFLTATPFQLGHHELLSVISRFDGIAWRAVQSYSREQFEADWTRLAGALDRAQHSAVNLDSKWKSLKPTDLAAPDGASRDVDEWWCSVRANAATQPERVQVALRAYEQCRGHMKEAEALLRGWVVRHLRDRELPEAHVDRRCRLVGRALDPRTEKVEGGLVVDGEALLPFLLAARAQATIARDSQNPGRATFAEGLASSYEAFLDTRRTSEGHSTVDEVEAAATGSNERLNRYLEKLKAVLPDHTAYARHPKVLALVDRVTDLWSKGEKVVVFCHYRETGRALVRHVSSAIENRLWTDAERRLGLTGCNLREQVMAFGQRFDARGGMRQPLDEFLDGSLSGRTALSADERTFIKDVVRRFVRTPLFVARFFDVRQRSGHEALETALVTQDASGVTLRSKIEAFVRFIADRCEPHEREGYLKALDQVHPGARGERPHDVEGMENAIGADLLPNVRLANGVVRQATRQRLLLSFNTPFFPEVLIASSVLAEGVDLHLNCRHVIHHDLSWNPSTLEQRTGRVDRMGAKAEWAKQPIQVFLPFIEATQDEKQYRVVMDRERWFQVLMGEDYRTDEASTDKLAERVLLPLAAAEALAFDLSVRPEA